MAAPGENDVEYESDPEEAKRSLTMRRREASDDEEGEEDGDGTKREGAPRTSDSRDGVGSDVESDGEGAPAEYDDEESEIEEEELGREDEEEEEGEAVVEEEEYDGGGGEVEAAAAGAGLAAKELDGNGGRSLGESVEIRELNQSEEGKKENDPFSVPTAGAFYMHDDRFRDNAGGRHRRTFGGRKLWESKDEKKWGHDKFEEMTLQDRHYRGGMRNSRGRYRGRGRSRGADRGYPRGNKSKAYNNDNQNHEPMVVKGRGSRRSGKLIERTSHTTSARAPTTMPNAESDPLLAKKQLFASSLSSASPPFYPSGSSNKETISTEKRDTQGGTLYRNLRSPVVDENISIPQSSTMMRGKNVVGSIGMEKLYISDSNSLVSVKPSTSLQLPSRSSSFSTTEPLQPRAQGRGVAASGQMPFQAGVPQNQATRASPPTQLHTFQRLPAQSSFQPLLQASVQQTGQHIGSGSQTPSPPKPASPVASFEHGESESPPESSKPKTALVGKGKGGTGGTQGSGRNPFLYGGAQLMGASGNMGAGHGDQNFATAPAFLPVMPFGGQHPGGIGVPAVGMAFPGYVAQPQLGLGNSEMTWLPVLAGAAGALGATYCSPYIPVDGSHNSRSSGQTSFSGPLSKENNTSKPNNERQTSQRPEVASDEFSQRHKNTRRYTEMNFGQ
ncbi:protein MLN51 homolog isoform X2 [Diospyros lotus]|uniref:protein MLN51 homolog isoform X2 n=1 Tax=Diospyros lotus TaxID=55363 RepID=UPI002254B0EF|nr:protein MLN51 homolog isoform X2 [Diospyros lotus]